jgi:predicted MFS family arabinose efflux permease
MTMLGIDDNNRKWWVLAAMGAILGVILLDETVVGVALPTMQVDLDMSEVTSHWVVNIYMLVLVLKAGIKKPAKSDFFNSLCHFQTSNCRLAFR